MRLTIALGKEMPRPACTTVEAVTEAVRAAQAAIIVAQGLLTVQAWRALCCAPSPEKPRRIFACTERGDNNEREVGFGPASFDFGNAYCQGGQKLV